LVDQTEVAIPNRAAPELGGRRPRWIGETDKILKRQRREPGSAEPARQQIVGLAAIIRVHDLALHKPRFSVSTVAEIPGPATILLPPLPKFSLMDASGWPINSETAQPRTERQYRVKG
jgi:hypothetical protein